jgi:hypothetical protein
MKVPNIHQTLINRVLETGEIDERYRTDDILLISTDNEYTTVMNEDPGIMIDIRPHKNILIVSCNWRKTRLMTKLAEEYLIELNKSSLPEPKELYIIDLYETNTGIGSYSNQANLGYVEQLMYRCKELTANTTVSLVNPDGPDAWKTASFRTVDQFDCYYSYPFSILDRTKTKLKSFKEENVTTDYKSSPSKHFICMNANPIVKRIDFVNYLHQDKVIDKCHLSWLALGYNDNLVLDEKPDDENAQFDYSKRLILDYEPEDLRTNGNYESVPSFHYLSDSLIDIGIETNSESISAKFITEKTWKPYLFGKVGFQYNYSGYYSDLETFGFHLYDEIFDYTFDKLENPKIRFKEYCKEIKRISEISIEELTEKIISIERKILSNRYHVWNYKFPMPTVLKEYPNLGIGLNE